MKRAIKRVISMKISISLSDNEVTFLDHYARSRGVKSRSAVVRRAVQLLHSVSLADDYACAFDESIEDTDVHVWDHSTGDGLDRADTER